MIDPEILKSALSGVVPDDKLEAAVEAVQKACYDGESESEGTEIEIEIPPAEAPEAKRAYDMGKRGMER